jgi:preprotein translocase subunit SecG
MHLQKNGGFKMVGEYILLAVLLLSAIFIVASVTIQKTNDEGLSGTIAGGSETYYGKDKSMRAGRLLNKWTLIAIAVFAVAVLLAYFIQPDYTHSHNNLDYWQQVSEFSSIFKK